VVSLTASRLFDGFAGSGAGVFAASVHRGRRGRGFDTARLAGVALQVGQGNTQAAPVGIWQFLPQWTDCLRPVSGFAGAGDDNDRTAGFTGIGRFPECEEAVAAGLQLLLLLLWDLSLKGRRFFLTTLK